MRSERRGARAQSARRSRPCHQCSQPPIKPALTARLIQSDRPTEPKAARQQPDSLRRDESNKPRALLPESRRRFLGSLPGNLPEQNPGGRPAQPAVQHERLLLQAEGAGSEHPAEQERQQDGNPAACYRLHPGPADRAGLQPASPRGAAGAERVPDPADRPQHRHQHPVVTVPGVSVRAADR